MGNDHSFLVAQIHLSEFQTKPTDKKNIVKTKNWMSAGQYKYMIFRVLKSILWMDSSKILLQITFLKFVFKIRNS